MLVEIDFLLLVDSKSSWFIFELGACSLENFMNRSMIDQRQKCFVFKLLDRKPT